MSKEENSRCHFTYWNVFYLIEDLCGQVMIMGKLPELGNGHSDHVCIFKRKRHEHMRIPRRDTYI